MSPFFPLKRFLHEFRQLGAGCGFDVEWVKGGVKVLSELFKSFLGVSDGGVSQLIIPSFGIGGSSPIAHIV